MGLGPIGKLVILRGYTATTQNDDTKITPGLEALLAAAFRVPPLKNDHAHTGYSNAIG